MEQKTVRKIIANKIGFFGIKFKTLISNIKREKQIYGWHADEFFTTAWVPASYYKPMYDSYDYYVSASSESIKAYVM